MRGDTLSTELALRQSEERFRQLVQGARDYAIVMLDQRRPRRQLEHWGRTHPRV